MATINPAKYFGLDYKLGSVDLNGSVANIEAEFAEAGVRLIESAELFA